MMTRKWTMQELYFLASNCALMPKRTIAELLDRSVSSVTQKATSLKLTHFKPDFTRENNNNWRGGISIGTNGYIKVLVGVEHHLADSKGYAYEHCLVAEEKIGRRLRKGEEVHHEDENRQNNTPDNLKILSRRQHRFEHRRIASDKRTPDEDNPAILCRCGCQQSLTKYDPSNRPRKFIQGHQNNRFTGKANHERAGL